MYEYQNHGFGSLITVWNLYETNWDSGLNSEPFLEHCILNYNWHSVSAFPFRKVAFIHVFLSLQQVIKPLVYCYILLYMPWPRAAF